MCPLDAMDRQLTHDIRLGQVAVLIATTCRPSRPWLARRLAVTIAVEIFFSRCYVLQSLHRQSATSRDSAVQPYPYVPLGPAPCCLASSLMIRESRLVSAPASLAPNTINTGGLGCNRLSYAVWRAGGEDNIRIDMCGP